MSDRSKMLAVKTAALLKGIAIVGIFSTSTKGRRFTDGIRR